MHPKNIIIAGNFSLYGAAKLSHEGRRQAIHLAQDISEMHGKVLVLWEPFQFDAAYTLENILGKRTRSECPLELNRPVTEKALRVLDRDMADKKKYPHSETLVYLVSRDSYEVIARHYAGDSFSHRVMTESLEKGSAIHITPKKQMKLL